MWEKNMETLNNAMTTIELYLNNPELIAHTVVPVFTEQEGGILDLLRIFLAAVFGPVSAF
jgi:hypothetical protein